MHDLMTDVMPRKILFVIGSLQGGGAERVACHLVNHWVDSGISVTLATLEPLTAAPAYELNLAAIVRRLDTSWPVSGKLMAVRRMALSVIRLRKVMKEVNPDVVVSFIDQTNILSLLASTGLDLPVVVSERVHPAHYDIGRFWNALRKFTYRYATRLVVQTTEIAKWSEKRFRCPVDVIPNPVFSPEHEALEDDQHSAASTVVAAGRLMPQKGFDILISAFNQLVSRFPNWRLIIWGEGHDRATLEKQIQSAGLESRVLLPGWTKDLACEFSQADIFALSSRFEGFPNVLCEAMAAGLPCVSTRCPTGPQDVIRDGYNGLLVDVDDPDSLAEGLAALMIDDDMRTRLGKAAKNISEEYSISRVACFWQKSLSAAMESGKRGKN